MDETQKNNEARVLSEQRWWWGGRHLWPCWERLSGPDHPALKYTLSVFVTLCTAWKWRSCPHLVWELILSVWASYPDQTRLSCWEKAAGFLAASLDYIFPFLWLIIKIFVLTCKLISANWSQPTWEENYLWLQFGCKASRVFLPSWVENWNYQDPKLHFLTSVGRLSSSFLGSQKQPVLRKHPKSCCAPFP